MTLMGVTNDGIVVAFICSSGGLTTERERVVNSVVGMSFFVCVCVNAAVSIDIVNINVNVRQREPFVLHREHTLTAVSTPARWCILLF